LIVDRLRGGLIVSVQAWPGSAIDDPHVIAAMAKAARENGAAAVRVEGAANLRAVRERVDIPIVGLIKREYAGFEPYITPAADDVRTVIECGAEVVAFDATLREHPGNETVASLIETIRASGRVAMADCASAGEAELAAGARAQIVATTLCGYTRETSGRPLPALDLVAEMRRRIGGRALLVCEGGIRSPQQVSAAFEAGADAVVVGTAITNVDWLVREFAGATPRLR
jgi:N-acylglucosamine-6-phosphate 2-epimerase